MVRGIVKPKVVNQRATHNYVASILRDKKGTPNLVSTRLLLLHYMDWTYAWCVIFFFYENGASSLASSLFEWQKKTKMGVQI
jgi:hypothetical protein